MRSAHAVLVEPAETGGSAEGATGLLTADRLVKSRPVKGAPDTAAEVVVLDQCPAYRRGVAAALDEAGFRVRKPEDLHAWAGGEGARAVLATFTPDERELVARLRQARAGVVIIAVLDTTGSDGYREALQGGATAAVSRNAPLPEIVRVLHAAIAGWTLLPSEVARSLAANPSLATHTTILSDDQMRWIRLLAGGKTVAQLAEIVGYSERAMHRHLRELYGRLGARNRTEALVQAACQGLIDCR